MEAGIARAGASNRPYMAAFAVIGSAFAIPVIASMGGTISAFHAGMCFARLATLLLVIGGIALLVTLRRSTRAKAIGLAIAGLLLCAAAMSNVHAMHDKETVQALLARLLAFQQEQRARDDALDKQAERIMGELGPLLKPQVLVTPAGLASARAKFAQFRALIDQHDVDVRNAGEAGHRLVASLPEGPMRTAGEQRWNESRQGAVKVQAQVDAAMHHVVTAVGDLLDWVQAQSQLGKLSVRGDKWLLSSQAQIDTLRELGAALDRSSDEANRAATAFSAYQASWKIRNTKAISDLQSFTND